MFCAFAFTFGAPGAAGAPADSEEGVSDAVSVVAVARGENVRASNTCSEAERRLRPSGSALRETEMDAERDGALGAAGELAEGVLDVVAVERGEVDVRAANTCSEAERRLRPSLLRETEIDAERDGATGLDDATFVLVANLVAMGVGSAMVVGFGGVTGGDSERVEDVGVCAVDGAFTACFEDLDVVLAAGESAADLGDRASGDGEGLDAALVEGTEAAVDTESRPGAAAEGVLSVVHGLDPAALAGRDTMTASSSLAGL
ncbi:hypothetical protein B0H17DRAFT_1128126 [Mycena rosella]|uniref:Uncharacterized protein n=1 Tax=Mycena rosella TaxID=1033263 RepID=A0AAD7DYG2_MYCRO|nr:hypothetical protein B0H17DRAFT_1128126 [Mycena rosella]